MEKFIWEKKIMGIGLDRISNLPDSILEFILSLVPLKSAVRTSILAKRWRNLWLYKLSSTSVLDFDEEFSSSQSPTEFVTVVDRYLQLCSNDKLERLRIFFCPFDMFAPNIERWVKFAETKGVQELDLDLSQGLRDPRDGEFTDERKPFKLPASLFGRESLTNLSLSRCDFCTPSEFKRLGCLRLLNLSHVNINDDMLQSILTECPILESLSLKNCSQLRTVHVSGDDLRLERFTMVDCLKVYSLEISAPKLQSLILFGNLNFMFRFIDISSLVDAFISSIGRETYGNCTMFLPDLAHVKILTFAPSYVAEFEEPEEDEAEFTIPLPNLQELQLLVDVMSEENISQIYRFFHICPSPFLEKLLIRLPRYLEDPTGTEYIPTTLNQPTNVVFDHLKEIKLSNFRGCILEMRLVKFLLEKAITLERLVLIAPPMELNEGIKNDQVGLSSQSKFSERIGLRIIRGQLSTLPKASLNVSIAVQEFLEDDMSLNPVHGEVYCEQSFSSIQKMFEPSFEEFVSAQSEFL